MRTGNPELCPLAWLLGHFPFPSCLCFPQLLRSWEAVLLYGGMLQSPWQLWSLGHVEPLFPLLWWAGYPHPNPPMCASHPCAW